MLGVISPRFSVCVFLPLLGSSFFWLVWASACKREPLVVSARSTLLGDAITMCRGFEKHASVTVSIVHFALSRPPISFLSTVLVQDQFWRPPFQCVSPSSLCHCRYHVIVLCLMHVFDRHVYLLGPASCSSVLLSVYLSQHRFTDIFALRT